MINCLRIKSGSDELPGNRATDKATVLTFEMRGYGL
jgi:hypothetical protein